MSKEPSVPKVIRASNNSIKVSYNPESNSVNLLSGSVFPAYTTGGWGDPHMYLRLKGTDRFLCRWGDNKSGDEGKDEILYLYMRTSFDTIQVYYTNDTYTPNGAKVTTNIRVVFNNTTYNIDQNFVGIFGPVRVAVRRIPYGSGTYYLNYEIDWDPIPNLREIGGALGIVFKRSLQADGSYINGGDGRFWDGYSVLGQPLGLSRTDFVVAQGQNMKAMSTVAGLLSPVELKECLSEDGEPLILSKQFLNPETLNLTEGVEEDDPNENNIGESVDDWDPTASDAKFVFETDRDQVNNLIGQALVNNVTTQWVIGKLGVDTTVPPSWAIKSLDILLAEGQRSSLTLGGDKYTIPTLAPGDSD